jgi:adenylylsulfate kinase-like enzyme
LAIPGTVSQANADLYLGGDRDRAQAPVVRALVLEEHRGLNIRCIGFVGAEITKNSGIALCAPIAPYDRVRKEVDALIGPGGGFVLVYAGAGWTTPVSGRVCVGNTA